MTTDDRRLIEDYLPIGAISAEASREKSVRKGHISTLHLWWARRPLVACRAAVYGALVPASRFRPTNGPEEKRDSLARANATKFVERLCKYPGDPGVIAEAQQHIVEAHAQRLTRETGKLVRVEDILEGRASRPKVLDIFAGGGSIPLEALRLGCEAYALELNPVAHIIELCTLVYPQKYGKSDKNAKGSGKDGTWAGLAEEVRYWGNLVLEKAKAETGDLYPLIPDPKYKGKRPASQSMLWSSGMKKDEVPPGFLLPVAYVWTRTVRCKNPSCGATVPLVKQTWLCKETGRYVALKMLVPNGEKRVRFEVVESDSERGLGFDPAAFSKGGNATCPYCGTVSDTDYVKAEGCAGRMEQQRMAVVCTRPGVRGKVYLSDDIAGSETFEGLEVRTVDLCRESGLVPPDEPLPPYGVLGFRVQPYGLRRWSNLHGLRQLHFLLTIQKQVRACRRELNDQGYTVDHTLGVISCLGLLASTMANSNSSICYWIPQNEQMASTFARNALQMTWDYCEINPLANGSGNATDYLRRMVEALRIASDVQEPAVVARGSASDPLPFDTGFDAVVTDPPYYDNVPYSTLSDFFYVWLKRAVGDLYPEHFGAELTPKKKEIVSEPFFHGGDKGPARHFYEAKMAEAFRNAAACLKPEAPLVVVYAHKTTLGWSALIEALRSAGFMVTEAWPLDTEKPGRPREQDSAALASSIFLVARRREGAATGSYEDEVRSELEAVVRERVETLWDKGIAGADLVIAAVGAGLRAFTRFGKVEYANGEEVPAERFLVEVEGVVLDTLLEKIFGVPRSGMGAVDGPSRFYVLWRYTYKAAELDAGEAIVFTYGQPVELDGPKGLSTGGRALLEKKKGKYRLRDFAERGEDEKLGISSEDGAPGPLVDVLHRILWLMENEPRNLPRFLDEAHPDRERLRLVAQALAGASLKGKTEEEAKALVATTAPEQAALAKLTANWRSLVDQRLAASEGSLFGRKGR